MNEVANTSANLPSTLDRLAAEAQMFVQNAALNLLHLGRVLTDAKPLVPHGEWAGWVKQNAKMSLRTAQQYMQAYAEFGLNSRIVELGTSKVLKLLPMPEEEREKLLEENDVSSMTTRELDDAIRRQRDTILRERDRLREEARAEVRAEIDAEREARLAAERRAEEAENRPPEVPEELVEQLREHKETIARQKDEIKRLADVGSESIAEQRRLIQENNGLKRDLKEQAEDLEAMQTEYSRAQNELLNMQSQLARGDAERVPSDELTVDVFASAVRQFIGTCARMPHMGATFSTMTLADKNDYDVLLKTIEGWARDARKALNATAIEGMVIR